MAQRHKDALAIIEGACNPSGIAHSFLAACEELRKELAFRGTDQLRTDPALRLMTHQLTYLMDVGNLPLDDFHRLIEACKQRRVE